MFEGSEDTQIILQQTKLDGISNITFDVDIQQEAVLLLANRGINRKINKPSVATCTFSKNYIAKDFVQQCTGVANLSGQFIYGSNALNFTDAAITDYSVSMKANELPTISATLKIFGDLEPTTALVTASGDYQTVKTAGINLNVENKTSAVSTFNYKVSFDARPTYEIESTKSSTAKILTPVKYSASAKLELSEQEFESMTGAVNNESFSRTVQFNMTDPTGGAFDSLSVPNAGLSKQSISMAAEDTIGMDIEYQGYGLEQRTGQVPNFPS